MDIRKFFQTSSRKRKQPEPINNNNNDDTVITTSQKLTESPAKSKCFYHYFLEISCYFLLN